MEFFKGILSKKIFNSRVNSQDTTGKERWLGYLLGPAGALLLNAVLATYLNVYYTDVLGLTSIWGGAFLVIFPIVSQVINAIVNIVMGYVIDRTRTKQGKARPWILFSAPVITISGILLFAVPEMSTTLKVIWIIFSYNLFYSFAFTIFSMSHNLMAPLSTRDTTQRGKLSVFNQIATIMMSGIIVALVFPTVIMPKVGIDKGNWITIMSVISFIALPLTLLEYYYTKERVTEESVGKEQENISYKRQLKVIFKDKYMVIIFAYFLIYIMGSNLKNLSLVYYCNYVLGTYNDGVTQSMLSIIGGIPMGIGVFVVWPLAKKFGKRNLTVAGFILYAVGSIICWIFPSNMIIVLIGQFIKNIGGLPCAYVIMALFADTLDHIEWKAGFRCDGIAMSVYNTIAVTAGGICIGIFNGILSFAGYVSPYYDKAGSLIAVQTETVKNVITFSFVGLETITSIIMIILLLSLNVEKDIIKKQEEIKMRREMELC